MIHPATLNQVTCGQMHGQIPRSGETPHSSPGTGRNFTTNALNRANTACESRHVGSTGRSNRCESGTVELTRRHQVVHYGGDTTLIREPGHPAKAGRPTSGLGDINQAPSGRSGPAVTTTACGGGRFLLSSRSCCGAPVQGPSGGVKRRPFPRPGVAVLLRPLSKGPTRCPGRGYAVEMQWLDEPKLGTRCPAGTEQPIRGSKPGRSEGPREAEWMSSPLFWRARPVAATSPRPP